jgi:hypothetical protein
MREKDFVLERIRTGIPSSPQDSHFLESHRQKLRAGAEKQ